MNLILLFIGVFAMYWRTLKYNYIIDDNVKRDGYLYEVPLTAPMEKREERDGKIIITACTYDRKPSPWYRLFMIGMHCVNTFVVYLLWGWEAALLFAIHPACVWGTAWVTGNYYATTAYFCLIAYYILHTFPNMYGAAIAMALYATALNSTIEALAFPFILLAVGNVWGFAMLFPLVMFLTGKRFQTGIKIREDFINEQRIKGFSIRRLILMVKVIGRYLFTALYPDRLGFFGPFGRNIHDSQEVYDKMHSADKEFWQNLVLCGVVFIAGLMIHPLGTLWFFGFIALHSQWKIMGQFFAVRYLYIAVPGLCAVLGTAFHQYPVAMAILATYYAIRTYVHIYAFRNVETIWRNDFDTWPEDPEVWNNMAQAYMRKNQQHKPLASWELNLIAAYILKAVEMNSKSWAINMNAACFYAIIGQWPLCLKYTDDAIDILKSVSDKPCGPLKQLQSQRERIIRDAGKAVAAPETKGSAESSLPVGQSKEMENGTGTKETATSVKCG